MQKKLAIVQLARHREPALLVIGQSISNLGDGVALVALTLLVLDTTNNDAARLAWFVALGLAPLGLVVAGQLVNVVGVRTYFTISALVTILPGLWILPSPRINEIDGTRVRER